MTGSGTALDPYIISDVDDLQAMENHLDAYYELGGNIDASATVGWNGGAGFLPIGQAADFTGQLDGKGYTIDQLFINRPSSSVALFASGDMKGVIQNLGLTNLDFTGKYTGAIAENNYGTITKCYATGSVDGGASDRASGFVFNNQSGGTITNCYTRCSVNGKWAYGFVSINYSGATIDDCYSTGAVTGTYTGGFCGSNSGTITNCFWDTETSGQASSDGGTGKTTAEMKTKATFVDAGWDFTTPIWYISSEANDGYPSFEQVLTTPTVTTDPATSVGQTTGTPNGTLDDDGGKACEVRFQYGETTDYGTNTEWQSGKVTGDTFEQEIRGLMPGRVYHFRAQARNSEGTVNGADRTFHTEALSAAAHEALGKSHPLGRAEL